VASATNGAEQPNDPSKVVSVVESKVDVEVASDKTASEQPKVKVEVTSALTLGEQQPKVEVAEPAPNGPSGTSATNVAEPPPNGPSGTSATNVAEQSKMSRDDLKNSNEANAAKEKIRAKESVVVFKGSSSNRVGRARAMRNMASSAKAVNSHSKDQKLTQPVEKAADRIEEATKPDEKSLLLDKSNITATATESVGFSEPPNEISVVVGTEIKIESKTESDENVEKASAVSGMMLDSGTLAKFGERHSKQQQQKQKHQRQSNSAALQPPILVSPPVPLTPLSSPTSEEAANTNNTANNNNNMEHKLSRRFENHKMVVSSVVSRASSGFLAVLACDRSSVVPKFPGFEQSIFWNLPHCRHDTQVNSDTIQILQTGVLTVRLAADFQCPIFVNHRLVHNSTKFTGPVDIPVTMGDAVRFACQADGPKSFNACLVLEFTSKN
jgi:hypothetical protein